MIPLATTVLRSTVRAKISGKRLRELIELKVQTERELAAPLDPAHDHRNTMLLNFAALLDDAETFRVDAREFAMLTQIDPPPIYTGTCGLGACGLGDLPSCGCAPTGRPTLTLVRDDGSEGPHGVDRTPPTS